jgi:hypothetical protein
MASRAAQNAKAKMKEAASESKLQEAFKSALTDRGNAVDIGGFLADLIEIWGGPRRLAQDMHREFQEAAVGGMTRQRILEQIGRYITYATDRQITRAVRPSEMTDAELDLLAMDYMRKISGETSNLLVGTLLDPDSKDATNGGQEAHQGQASG